ncbi:hypothetical protein B0H16DRAFT_1858810 [Mycena metata]|uniref:F-box domain-containing protein n=1 Tax=Mycena metata TaxID=1033252 RepID=A0AAD7NU26_9AGAR|nr:hypothetical protein B0H16DRAFT_1858810 [Mycena metata]
MAQQISAIAFGEETLQASIGLGSLLSTRGVLLCCSPFDLVQIRRTSKRLKSVLEDPLFWAAARKRIDDVPAPPVVTASGCWTENAYANFLFGRSVCVVCHHMTDGLPSVFALNFRCCPVSCYSRIESGRCISIKHWTVFAAARADSYATIGFLEFLPPVHRAEIFVPPATADSNAAELDQAERVADGSMRKGGKPAFPVRDVPQLRQEWDRRQESWTAILANHTALCKWKQRVETTPLRVYDHTAMRAQEPRYSQVEFIVQTIEQLNSERLSVFAIEHGFDKQDLAATPTAIEYLRYFNRDKTPIFISSILLLLPRLKYELRALEHHRRSLRKGPLQPDVHCSRCDRWIPWADFTHHCVARHPREKLVCTYGVCAGLQKSFSPDGLLSHTRAAHLRK